MFDNTYMTPARVFNGAISKKLVHNKKKNKHSLSAYLVLVHNPDLTVYCECAATDCIAYINSVGSGVILVPCNTNA